MKLIYIKGETPTDPKNIDEIVILHNGCQQVSENLMNRFRGMLKNVDLGPKNTAFIPFWS